MVFFCERCLGEEVEGSAQDRGVWCGFLGGNGGEDKEKLGSGNGTQVEIEKGL